MDVLKQGRSGRPFCKHEPLDRDGHLRRGERDGSILAPYGHLLTPAKHLLTAARLSISVLLSALHVTRLSLSVLLSALHVTRMSALHVTRLSGLHVTRLSISVPVLMSGLELPIPDWH